PMFSLKYVFRKIMEATGVKIVGDFVEHQDVKRLIFFNNHSLDYFEDSLPDYTTRTFYDRIIPGNHLPDMTILDLLLELGKLFSLGFDFNNDDMTLELFFRKKIVIDDSFIEASNKTNPKFDLSFGQNEGYTISYKWNSKDIKFNPESPGVMTPIVIGDGKEKIDLKLHTTFMTRFRTPPLPIVDGIPNPSM